MDRWRIEVRHDGLNKYRVITGTDKQIVERKAAAQLAAWDAMWETRLVGQRRANEWQSKIALAAKRTQDANEATKALTNIIAHTLSINDAVNWEYLKDHSHFPKAAPRPPESEDFDPEPQASWPVYKPTFNILDDLFPSRKKHKERERRERFERDHADWAAAYEKFSQNQSDLKQRYEKELAAWEKEKADFIDKQKSSHEQVDIRRTAYESMDPGAIIDYCDIVLTRSVYPDYFPQEWDVDYNAQTRILVVDYTLPSVESIPRTKEVKYVQSRDVFDEKLLPDSVFNKLYDNIIYQITLRTVHELFEADVVNALDMVAFNGYVNSIDRATGYERTTCIVSMQAKKEEFRKINLAQVDPKACFRNLKGVGSSRLHSVTAIPPLLSIEREDRRFVSSHAVVDSLDIGVNLASLDWEEFEHLIRELFEKEFAASGGECKVTRASRDGGVDAIAFNPDPIRGGKIVIQAKRYTNTVGVSAVRDLYGTVLNEGATKGILVTTADYGPDAYEFAKGKPLTLLNGSNLLSLLEKHGHRSFIDINAAKQDLKISRLSDGN